MPTELSAQKIIDHAPGYFCVAPNLYFDKRSPAGARSLVGSWTLSYVSEALVKRVWMGLGAAPDISLHQARLEALKHRLALRQGRCPLCERRAVQAARKAGRRACRTAPSATSPRPMSRPTRPWRSGKHAQASTNTLETYCYPKIGALPVGQIDVAEIMDVLEPIWPTIPETAARVRGRIESVLDYARARKWRTSDVNPARWKGGLDSLLPARGSIAPVKHDDAAPWRSLPALYQQLAQATDAPALALRYAIVTACRTGEVRLTPAAGEIDYAHKLHVIPAVRTKAHRVHEVPLSDEALAILAAAERVPHRTVPVQRCTPRPAVVRHGAADPAARCATRLQVDGARHAGILCSWAAEAGIGRELAEAQLAHTLRDKTEAAYQRSALVEARRPMMETWARLLTTPGIEADHNVVPIRERLAAG